MIRGHDWLCQRSPGQRGAIALMDRCIVMRYDEFADVLLPRSVVQVGDLVRPGAPDGCGDGARARPGLSTTSRRVLTRR